MRRALLALLAVLCAKASDGCLWLSERLTRTGERLLRAASEKT